MTPRKHNFSSTVVKSRQSRSPPAHLDGARVQQHGEHMLAVNPHVRLLRRSEHLDRNPHFSLATSIHSMYSVAVRHKFSPCKFRRLGPEVHFQTQLNPCEMV